MTSNREKTRLSKSPPVLLSSRDDDLVYIPEAGILSVRNYYSFF